jgi:hypothetical protein
LCVSTGFNAIIDKIAEDFSFKDILDKNVETGLPMAKLIPILNRISIKNDPDPILTHLLAHQSFQTFVANVYETFCLPVQPVLTTTTTTRTSAEQRQQTRSSLNMFGFLFGIHEK